METQGSQQSS